MAFTTLALSGTRAVVAARASEKATKNFGAAKRPAFAPRRQSDAGFSKRSSPSSRSRTSFLTIARAEGGEGEDLDEEENARRTASGEVDVEVVEDDEEEEEEDGEGAEADGEPAAVSRGAELLAQLQQAIDDGNAADVLAEVLPELTSEVAEMTEGFGNLKAANVGLEDQAGALKDQYLRLNADFDNYKKRTLKEKEQLAQTAKSKLFESMLPALDNFDLAKANLKTEGEGEEKIASSYQGLFDGLMTILSTQGLSTVEGVGAPFDPNFHEAIMREESTEYPEDTVIEEFRKGYKMGEDTLIRAAMVKVSMEASAPAEEGEGGDGDSSE